MEIRRGIGVSSGYAIGEALVFDREVYRIARRKISAEDVQAELGRLEAASKSGAEEVRAQIAAMPERVREVAGPILEAQARMLQDEAFLQEIGAEVRRKQAAELAVSRTIRRKIKVLQDSGAAAFAERITDDLVDLEKVLLRNLLGSKREDVSHLTGKAVVVAHDLSPSQTIGLDRTKVLGMLTEVGGPTSHSAIVAKTLGLPAVVGAEGVLNEISGGDTIIVDGFTGTVIIGPDEATLKRYQAMARNYVLTEQQRAKELHDLPAETQDGTRVRIYANIETPEEIPWALEHGAEGIGLYRTEFLYLDNRFCPSEKDHLEAYRRAVTLLGDRPIVIRTMDLGADKMPVDGMEREDNPFLGTRAIRLCFDRPDMFRTQLRAILKVAGSGKVGMMIPMISSLSEVRQVKEAIESVREELRAEGEPSGEGIRLGIMVEVPAAAIMSDMLAPHVDFFSVGTNDLIGYSVAVDRKNERVAPLYQPSHPAILRLLKQVIDAAKEHNKSVSVCGEMSSDLTYTLFLLGIGLRRFSVAPPSIPDLKKMIRSVTLKHAEEVAAKALTLSDAKETEEYLEGETRKILPDIP